MATCRNRWLIGPLVGLILTGCGPRIAVDLPAEDVSAAIPATESTRAGDERLLTFVAVGDIMPGSISPVPFFPSPSDVEFLSEIRGLIGSPDLALGNLEGTFAVPGMEPTKCSPVSREARRCFEFGIPPYLALFLLNSGISVLSLDNNHSEDYGLEGYVLTQAILAQTGLLTVPKHTSISLEIEGVRVAIIPFGFSRGSFHISDLDSAERIIADAARHADVVVVSFHGGAEGEDALHIRNTVEEFYGEDRGNLVEFAHAAVDAGADVVFGHGPHVPRAVELYRQRLIAYSLGNFWTYGNISIKGIKGVMPLLRLTVSSTGEFRSGKVESLRQRLPGIPEVDPAGHAVRIIAALSEYDIPENPIYVGASGDLIRRVNRLNPD